jgi:hypothetical protein
MLDDIKEANPDVLTYEDQVRLTKNAVRKVNEEISTQEKSDVATLENKFKLFLKEKFEVHLK